ncbi:MAG: hypothetical protein Q7T54_02055 [Candidatus Levybacteria bacterium]|nr:hypothetical protein [Candidatus Levybacteria bacterium]
MPTPTLEGGAPPLSAPEITPSLGGSGIESASQFDSLAASAAVTPHETIENIIDLPEPPPPEAPPVSVEPPHLPPVVDSVSGFDPNSAVAAERAIARQNLDAAGTPYKKDAAPGAEDRPAGPRFAVETGPRRAADQAAIDESIEASTPIDEPESSTDISAPIPDDLREAKDDYDSLDTQGKLSLFQNTASRARELGMDDPKPATDALTSIRTGSMTPEQFATLDPKVQEAVKPGLTEKQASLYAAGDNASEPPIRPDSPPPAGPYEVRNAGQHNADVSDAPRPETSPPSAETGEPPPPPVEPPTTDAAPGDEEHEDTHIDPLDVDAPEEPAAESIASVPPEITSDTYTNTSDKDLGEYWNKLNTDKLNGTIDAKGEAQLKAIEQQMVARRESDKIANPANLSEAEPVTEMGATELAQEHDRLFDTENRTDEQNSRLAEIEAKWDQKNAGENPQELPVVEPEGESVDEQATESDVDKLKRITQEQLDSEENFERYNSLSKDKKDEIDVAYKNFKETGRLPDDPELRKFVEDYDHDIKTDTEFEKLPDDVKQTIREQMDTTKANAEDLRASEENIVDEMSAMEIAEEQNRLSEKTDRTPQENARLQELEAAWDSKFSEAENKAPASTEAGKEPTPDPFKSKLEQDRARKQAAIDKFRNGKDLSDDDQRILGGDMAQMEDIQDMLDRGQGDKLDAYQKDIAEKYGMAAKEKPAAGSRVEREDKIRQLQAEIQRGDGSPEKNRELDRLKAEGAQEGKDLGERNVLRDRLLNPKGEPLSEDEHNRLDELNAKLEGRDKDLTPDERDTEVNRLAVKMAQDMMEGRPIDEDDLERFRMLKAEQAVKAAGVEAGRTAILEQIKEKLKDRRLKEAGESQVEKKTKEKLAELMNLEMQMLAVPRQLQELANQQDELKKDIKVKKSEIGNYSGNELQQKNRTELYPLMMGLAKNKKYIAHYANHGRVLRAKYKDTMADLNRTLKLNGRFGIVPDVIQHLDAMVNRAYADLKTDYDSVYASESSDARKAAKTAA